MDLKSLTVVFSNPAGATYRLGPLSQIYIKDRELRETQEGAVLARDIHFLWQTQRGTFSRFDCDIRCLVQLERTGGEVILYGPYRGFSSLNGIKFADHQLFCNYDEQTNDWYGYESGEHWDAIRVTAA